MNNGYLEDVGVFGDGHEAEVAAVGPAVDGDALHVDVAEGVGQPLEHFHLV